MNLNRDDYRKLEKYWCNVSQLKKELKYREWELLYNENTDENVGGGRSGFISKPVEQETIKKLSDKRYNNLLNIIDGIQHVYDNQLTDDMRVIVDMLFWDSDRNFYQVEDVASKVYLSVRQIHRIKREILEMTAKQIGYI